MFSSGAQNGPWRQVVGVVGDVRQRGIASVAAPEAYEVIQLRSRLYLALHTPLPPARLTPAVRSRWRN